MNRLFNTYIRNSSVFKRVFLVGTGLSCFGLTSSAIALFAFNYNHRLLPNFRDFSSAHRLPKSYGKKNSYQSVSVKKKHYQSSSHLVRDLLSKRSCEKSDNRDKGFEEQPVLLTKQLPCYAANNSRITTNQQNGKDWQCYQHSFSPWLPKPAAIYWDYASLFQSPLSPPKQHQERQRQRQKSHSLSTHERRKSEQNTNERKSSYTAVSEGNLNPCNSNKNTASGGCGDEISCGCTEKSHIVLTKNCISQLVRGEREAVTVVVENDDKNSRIVLAPIADVAPAPPFISSFLAVDLNIIYRSYFRYFLLVKALKGSLPPTNFFLVSKSQQQPFFFKFSPRRSPNFRYIASSALPISSYSLGKMSDEDTSGYDSNPSWSQPKSESRYKTMETTLEQMKSDIGSLSSKLKKNPNYSDSVTPTYSLSTEEPASRMLGDEGQQDSVTVASSLKEDISRLSGRLRGGEQTQYLTNSNSFGNGSSISMRKGCSKESNLSDSGFGSSDALQLQDSSISPVDTNNCSPMLSESAFSEDEEDFVEDDHGDGSGPQNKSWHSPSDYSGYNPFDKNYPELSNRTRELLAKIRQGRGVDDEGGDLISASVGSPPPCSPPEMIELELEDISLEDYIINSDDMLTFPIPAAIRPSHGSQFGSMRSLPPIVEEHPDECISSEESSSEEQGGEEDEATSHDHDLVSIDDDESEAESFVTVKSASSTVADTEIRHDDDFPNEEEELEDQDSTPASSRPSSVVIERATFVPGANGYDPYDCCESSSESDGESTLPQTSPPLSQDNFRMIMESVSQPLEIKTVTSETEVEEEEEEDSCFNADQQTEQDLSSPSNSEASWPSTGSPGPEITGGQETMEGEMRGKVNEEEDDECCSGFVAKNNGYMETSNDELDKTDEDDYDGYPTFSRRKQPENDNKRLSLESEESDSIVYSSEYDSDSGDEFDAAGAIERQKIRERLKTRDDSSLFPSTKGNHQQQNVGIFQPPLPRPSGLYRPQQTRRGPHHREKNLSIIEEGEDSDKSEEFQTTAEEEAHSLANSQSSNHKGTSLNVYDKQFPQYQENKPVGGHDLKQTTSGVAKVIKPILLSPEEGRVSIAVVEGSNNANRDSSIVDKVEDIDSKELQILNDSALISSTLNHPNRGLTQHPCCSTASVQLQGFVPNSQEVLQAETTTKSSGGGSLSAHFDVFPPSSSSKVAGRGDGVSKETMAQQTNFTDLDFGDVEKGREVEFKKTVVPAKSSTVSLPKGQVTAVASSRALVKRGRFGGGGDDVSGDSAAAISYPTASAMVKAEASAASPGVAAARATAKAASIASESAVKGSGGDEEDIHIYISTSCTIRRNNRPPSQLAVTSKEEMEQGVLLAISRHSHEDGTSPSTVTESVHLEKNDTNGNERPKENLYSLLRNGGEWKSSPSLQSSSESRSSITCELPSPECAGGRTAVEDAAFTALKSSFPAVDHGTAHEMSRSVANRILKHTAPQLRKSEQDLRFAEFRKTLDSLQSRHEDRVQKRGDSLKTTGESSCKKGPSEMDLLKFNRVQPETMQTAEFAHIPTSSSDSSSTSGAGETNFSKPLTISLDSYDNNSTQSSSRDSTLRSKSEYSSVLQTPVEPCQKSTSPEYILSASRETKHPEDRQREKRNIFFMTSPPDYHKIDQFSSLPASRTQHKVETPDHRQTENLPHYPMTHLRSVPDDDTIRFQSLQHRGHRRRFRATDIDSAISRGSMHDIAQTSASAAPSKSTYRLEAYDTSPGKYKSMSLFDLSSNLRRTPSNPALVFFSEAKSTTTLFETDIDTGEVNDQTVVLETNVDSLRNDDLGSHTKTQSMVNLHTGTSPESRMTVFDFDEGVLNRAQSMEWCNDPKEKSQKRGGLVDRLQEKAKSTNELRIAESLRKIEIPVWLDNAQDEPKYLLESEKDYPDGSASVPRYKKQIINPPRAPVVISSRVAISKSTPSLTTIDAQPIHIDLPSQKLKTSPSIRAKLQPINSNLRSVLSSVKSSPAPTQQEHSSNTVPQQRRSILKSLPKTEDPKLRMELSPSDFVPKNQTVATTKVTTKVDKFHENILFTKVTKSNEAPDSMPPPQVPELSLKTHNYRSIITVATESLHPKDPILLPTPHPKMKQASSAESINFIDDHGSVCSDTESISGWKPNKSQINGASLKSQPARGSTEKPTLPQFDQIRKRPSVSSRSSSDHGEYDSEDSSYKDKDTTILDSFYRRSEARLLKLRDSFDLATFFKNANYSLTSAKCQASLSPDVASDDLILESMEKGRVNLREYFVDQDASTIKQDSSVGVVRLLCGASLCQKEEALLRDRSTEFVSCYNCYTYYCSTRCRLRDMSRHSQVCTSGRSKKMCSQLLKSFSKDQIDSFSSFALANYDIHGRGSIFLAFESYAIAKKFMMGEKNTLIGPPLYLSSEELFDFDATLATPCKNYNTDKSFVLSVVICAASSQNSSEKVFKQCIVLPLTKPREYSQKKPVVTPTKTPIVQTPMQAPLISSSITPTKKANVNTTPENFSHQEVEKKVKENVVQPPPLPDKPPVSQPRPPLPTYNQAVSMTTTVVTTAPRALKKPPSVPVRTAPPPPKRIIKTATEKTPSSDSETDSDSGSYTSGSSESSSYESSPPPPKPRAPAAITPIPQKAPPKPPVNGDVKVTQLTTISPPVPQRRSQPAVTSLPQPTLPAPLPPRPRPVNQMHTRSEMFDLSTGNTIPPPVPRKRSTPQSPPPPSQSTPSSPASTIPPPAAYANRSNSGGTRRTPHSMSPLATQLSGGSNSSRNSPASSLLSSRTSSVSSPPSKEDREVYFARIQRFMRDRGINLRSQYPQVFDHLIQFVEIGRLFPPLNFAYPDPRLQSNAICTIRPFVDPVVHPATHPIRKPTIETEL